MSISRRPEAWFAHYREGGKPKQKVLPTRMAAEAWLADSGFEGRVQKRPEVWRARYRDESGQEFAQSFARKADGLQWLARQTVNLASGTHIAPKTAQTTMADWCETWLRGYSSKSSATVRQARTHLKRIEAYFGNRPVGAVRPSEVRDWVNSLRAEGLAVSTTYALHSRLAQVFADAVHDGIVAKSPVSRRTAPPAAKQRPYVATTEQVWALHDAMPPHFRPAILLGAFVGLRAAEIVALRTTDVDFMRGIVKPAIQYPDKPLKTEMSRTPVPIPQELALELGRVPAQWGSPTLVVGAFGRPVSPYTLETSFRIARATVDGLPEGFRLHDLRHYFASLLISKGLDVKVVQTRLRHASASVTLDTYSHLWPDRDESARAAIADVFAARADQMRTKASSAQ